MKCKDTYHLNLVAALMYEETEKLLDIITSWKLSIDLPTSSLMTQGSPSSGSCLC